MAEERNFELKVGLFIAVGILIFFVIVFSIGDVNFVKTGYRISTLFNFVNGITESAPVRLAGVDVGYIEHLELYYDQDEQRTKVRLDLYINNEDIKIEQSSVASINTLGLLGEKYLEITPAVNDTTFLAEGDALTGKDPVQMQDLTDTMKELADSASVVVARLKEGRGTIGKLLVDESIYDNLDDLVADIKAHPWKLLHKPRS